MLMLCSTLMSTSHDAEGLELQEGSVVLVPHRRRRVVRALLIVLTPYTTPALLALLAFTFTFFHGHFHITQPQPFRTPSFFTRLSVNHVLSFPPLSSSLPIQISISRQSSPISIPNQTITSTQHALQEHSRPGGGPCCIRPSPRQWPPTPTRPSSSCASSLW